jgi:hypothetical protein
MKQLLMLLIFMPLAGMAQDCAIKKEKDQFSQEPKVSTGFVSFKTTKRFQLSLDGTKKEIDFFFNFSSIEGQCFDDQSNVVVTFEGGKLKSTFKNTGSMNCEGLFHFTHKNMAATPSILQRLATKKIVSMKFVGANKSEFEVTLNEQQQEQMMHLVNCMVTEAKTLL